MSEEDESQEDPEQRRIVQSGQSELGDDLLSIFKSEGTEISELDSLIEGLEEVDVNDFAAGMSRVGNLA